MDQKIKDFAREISQQFPISTSDAFVFLSQVVKDAERKELRKKFYAELAALTEEYKGKFVKINESIIKISKVMGNFEGCIIIQGNTMSLFNNDDDDYTAIDISLYCERVLIDEMVTDSSIIKNEIEKHLITEEQPKEYFQEYLEIVKKNVEKSLF